MGQKNLKNKLLLCITIVVSFFISFNSLNVFAANVNVPNHTSEFYVNDFANIFSDDEKEIMMQRALYLEQNYDGIQVVVTTVSSLEESSPEEYAYEMYNQYGIGKDSMGILILLSTQDRQVRIETGYNMQSYITDSMSGRILDEYGMEHFKNNNFAVGLFNVQDAVINKITEKVPTNWNEKINAPKSSFDFGGFILNILLIVVFPVGVVALIAIGIKKLIQKRKDKREAEIQEAIDENDKKWSAKLKEMQKNHDLQMQNMNSNLSAKNDNIGQLNSYKEVLENKIKKLEERDRRVKKLHPGIDDEIAKMIESEKMQKAKVYDSSYSLLLAKEASKDNVDLFEKAINAYEQLEDDVKEYVSTDITKIKEKRRSSISLLQEYKRQEKIKNDISVSNEAFKQIEEFLNKKPEANYNNYMKIAAVYAIYMALTADQKSYLKDKSQVQHLLRINENAKADYENYNEAKKTENDIKKTISYIGSPDRYDVDKLKRAVREYKKLTEAQRVYFDSDLYRKLLRLLSTAEDDETSYRRRQEEQRRRMNSSSSHTSSFGSFGGHGGHSGGGGAGRSF